MIVFIIGMIIGGCIGFFTCGFLVASALESRRDKTNENASGGKDINVRSKDSEV